MGFGYYKEDPDSASSLRLSIDSDSDGAAESATVIGIVSAIPAMKVCRSSSRQEFVEPNLRACRCWEKLSGGGATTMRPICMLPVCRSRLMACAPRNFINDLHLLPLQVATPSANS